MVKTVAAYTGSIRYERRGKDGNSIVSTTVLYLLTTDSNVKSYDKTMNWAETFPIPSVQIPYVWKCVKTTYTQTAESFSKPELVTMYISVNPNVIKNASFVALPKMANWAQRSVYVAQASQAAPPNNDGLISSSYGINGHNGYLDKCTVSLETIQFKNILQQTFDGVLPREKLKGNTWYTFSFWAKSWTEAIEVKQRSNAYGFAEISVWLKKGVTYTINAVGSIDSTAVSEGKQLNVYVFKKNSNGSWAYSVEKYIKSTNLTKVTLTITPSETGEHFIKSYYFDNTTPRNGTAYIESYSITDNVGLETYIYPSAIDTSIKGYVNGQEKKLSVDGYTEWAENSNWVKYRFSFKTNSSLSSAQRVLFRMRPAICSQAIRHVAICEPKLEEGLIPTAFFSGDEDLKGEDGEKGFKGAVIRQHKEPESGDFTYMSGTDDEEFLDLLLVKEIWYRCLKTHTTSNPNVSDRNLWEVADTFSFIATELLLAKNATFELAGAQGFYVTDGKEVKGALKGTSSNTDYPFWLGARTPNEAYTKIRADGTLFSNQAYIGDTFEVRKNGLIVKRGLEIDYPTAVFWETIDSYDLTKDCINKNKVLVTTVLDLQKKGLIATFDESTVSLEFDLARLGSTIHVVNLPDEIVFTDIGQTALTVDSVITLNANRSLIGTRVTIYNWCEFYNGDPQGSGKPYNLTIRRGGRYSSNVKNTSFSLQKGFYISLLCRQWNDGAEEKIGWWFEFQNPNEDAEVDSSFLFGETWSTNIVGYNTGILRNLSNAELNGNELINGYTLNELIKNFSNL